MKNGRISNSDILNAALTHVPANRAKEWRNYFRALTIIRNKVSHSNTALNDEEVKIVEEAGFRTQEKVLHLDVGLHIQVIDHLTILLQELGNIKNTST